MRESTTEWAPSRPSPSGHAETGSAVVTSPEICRLAVIRTPVLVIPPAKLGKMGNAGHGLTINAVFDILSVRIFADIPISVCVYEYLFSEWKGIGRKPQMARRRCQRQDRRPSGDRGRANTVGQEQPGMDAFYGHGRPLRCDQRPPRRIYRCQGRSESFIAATRFIPAVCVRLRLRRCSRKSLKRSSSSPSRACCRKRSSARQWQRN